MFYILMQLHVWRSQYNRIMAEFSVIIVLLFCTFQSDQHTFFSAAATAAATALQTTIARFKAQLCTVISRI